MPSPLDTLIDRAAMTCTCCGAERGKCCCWEFISGDAATDHCDSGVGFGCAEHCKCSRCTANRESGLRRYYINTGTRHIAFVGDAKLLCGRAIPADARYRPMLTVRGTECARCRKALAKPATAKEEPCPKQ